MISTSVRFKKYFTKKVVYVPVLVPLPHLSADAMGHVGRDGIHQALLSLQRAYDMIFTDQWAMYIS